MLKKANLNNKKNAKILKIREILDWKGSGLMFPVWLQIRDRKFMSLKL